MAGKIDRDYFQRYDNRPLIRGLEERYLCPFCGDHKPKNNAHRCCCLNIEKEIYVCKRCGARGRFDRAPTEEASLDMLNKARARPRFTDAQNQERFEQHRRGIRPLPKRAADYLKGRGLPVEAATMARVGWSHSFYSGEAIVFPLYDGNGKLQAMSARYLDPTRYVQHRTVGEKLLGIFRTPGAFDGPHLVITEAPIDALTLFYAGIPAVATCGEGLPTWLLEIALDKTVVIATDNDKAGFDVAYRYTEALNCLLIPHIRTHPRSGKDWNQVLMEHDRSTVLLEFSEFTPDDEDCF